MKYARLSKAAKERARQWFKDTESEMWGSDRAPDYYEDMATCLKFLGIEVEQRTVKVSTQRGVFDRREWSFEWSGFCSQGDGLVFKGAWDAKDVDLSGLKDYAPQDAVLERIAIAMTALMLRWPEARAVITTVSHGPGLPSMHIDDAFTGIDLDGMNDDPQLPGEDVDTLNRLVADAAHWCYKTLEDNYESDTNDEAAESGIEANEYDFDIDGERSVWNRRGQSVVATDCPGAAS